MPFMRARLCGRLHRGRSPCSLILKGPLPYKPEQASEAENPEKKHADFLRLILFETILSRTSQTTLVVLTTTPRPYGGSQTALSPPWPYISRSRAAAARVAHNHEVAGSNPASATKISYVPWLIHLHFFYTYPARRPSKGDTESVNLGCPAVHTAGHNINISRLV